MSDKPEPLAAILAEMRREERPYGISNDRLRSYADRIEAAAKREREIARDLGRIDRESDNMARVADALEKANAPGNAAAMRESIETMRRYAMLPQDELSLSLLQRTIHEKCDAALAEPARNCDRFDEYHDAVDAWKKEERCLGRHQDGGTCNKDPLAPSLAPLCFARWAFAPAEGGDHA